MKKLSAYLKATVRRLLAEGPLLVLGGRHATRGRLRAGRYVGSSVARALVKRGLVARAEREIDLTEDGRRLAASLITDEAEAQSTETSGPDD